MMKAESRLAPERVKEAFGRWVLGKLMVDGVQFPADFDAVIECDAYDLREGALVPFRVVARVGSETFEHVLGIDDALHALGNAVLLEQQLFNYIVRTVAIFTNKETPECIVRVEYEESAALKN